MSPNQTNFLLNWNAPGTASPARQRPCRAGRRNCRRSWPRRHQTREPERRIDQSKLGQEGMRHLKCSNTEWRHLSNRQTERELAYTQYCYKGHQDWKRRPISSFCPKEGRLSGLGTNKGERGPKSWKFRRRMYMPLWANHYSSVQQETNT